MLIGVYLCLIFALFKGFVNVLFPLEKLSFLFSCHVGVDLGNMWLTTISSDWTCCVFSFVYCVCLCSCASSLCVCVRCVLSCVLVAVFDVCPFLMLC